MLFSQTRHDRLKKNDEISNINVVKTKDYGAFYTPFWLAYELLERSLKIINFINLKIVDPSCGEGVFIIAYLEYLKKNKVIIDEKVISNLYAFDIDNNSLVAAKNNILRFLREYDLPDEIYKKCKNIVEHNFINLDIYNLKDANYIFGNINFKSYFDIVIGNPPWRISRDRNDFDENRGTWAFTRHKCDVKLKEAKKNWRSTGFSKRDKDIYLTFLEAAKNIVKKRGIISFVLPDSFLRNTNSSPERVELIKKSKCILEEFQNTGKAFAIDSRKKFIFAIFTNFGTSYHSLLHSSGNKASRDGRMNNAVEMKKISISEIEKWSDNFIIPDLRDKTELLIFKYLNEESMKIKDIIETFKVNSWEHINRMIRGSDIQMYSRDWSTSKNSAFVYWRKISKDDNTRTLLTMFSNSFIDYDKNSVHMASLINEEEAISLFAYLNSVFSDFYIKTQMTVNITREMILNMPVINKNNSISKIIISLTAVRFFGKKCDWIKNRYGKEMVDTTMFYLKKLKSCDDAEFFAVIDHFYAMILGVKEDDFISFIKKRYTSFLKQNPRYLQTLMSTFLNNVSYKEVA